jgi:hypothetical protein
MQWLEHEAAIVQRLQRGRWLPLLSMLCLLDSWLLELACCGQTLQADKGPLRACLPACLRCVHEADAGSCCGAWGGREVA